MHARPLSVLSFTVVYKMIEGTVDKGMHAWGRQDTAWVGPKRVHIHSEVPLYLFTSDLTHPPTHLCLVPG